VHSDVLCSLLRLQSIHKSGLMIYDVHKNNRLCSFLFHKECLEVKCEGTC
jgi:hypothetical protein